ncbi:hypothetical protein [Sandaracinobacteroides saxicola]|uniref:DUF3598 domain-containing protein n=1 Tax=Sandaracinobacteroides saxicola TaxID=2759707 RepID=A0A7G5IE92_9SPHN|nr:hypothetical protein [Sandaracinobacteroides saxicola]QMW21684.1 hypothetical protein H3309_09665 [Sandaracinobacteroides saxicola]
MPAMLAHEGLWEGTYRHLDADGALIDQHAAQVRCEFPDAGDHAYIQHNRFTHPDGRVTVSTLPGTLRDGRLWWDLPAFHGHAWDAGDGMILLTLDRRDEPGVRFHELIVMGDADTRARTWHWFQGGTLIRRTLCNERRVG